MVQLYWRMRRLVRNIVKWLKHILQIELCSQRYDEQIFGSVVVQLGQDHKGLILWTCNYINKYTNDASLDLYILMKHW